MAGKKTSLPNLKFEKFLWGSGCKFVVGVDEAGVAPLAGPVVASAVVLPPDVSKKYLARINDSKLLSPAVRLTLYEHIISSCDYSVGSASPEEVDSLNIFHATRLAMKRAVEGLKNSDAVLVDGPHCIPGISLAQFAVTDGDAKIYSIAAASIVAKVTRDNLMSDLHLEYPMYGLQQHKGYPTPKHIAAVRQYGPSPYHRASFLKNILG